MHDLAGFAVRLENSIEVSLSGYLPSSCYQAVVDDIYPGGRRVHVVDPGAAQIFIKETQKPGSSICLMMLFPWGTTQTIPDQNHNRIDVYVNDELKLKIEVKKQSAQYIVVALVGLGAGGNRGCSILLEDAIYPAIYHRVFGPDTKDTCADWVKANCMMGDPV